MKLLQITDTVRRCDCCGQRRLKLTAELQASDGRRVHYALSCAARALGLGERQITAADAGTLVGLYQSRVSS